MVGKGNKYSDIKTQKMIKTFFDNAFKKTSRSPESIAAINKYLADKFGWIFKGE